MLLTTTSPLKIAYELSEWVRDLLGGGGGGNADPSAFQMKDKLLDPADKRIPAAVALWTHVESLSKEAKGLREKIERAPLDIRAKFVDNRVPLPVLPVEIQGVLVGRQQAMNRIAELQNLIANSMAEYAKQEEAAINDYFRTWGKDLMAQSRANLQNPALFANANTLY